MSLLMLLVLILHTCLMLRKNIVFGRCQRSLNMCTPAVHGIRVVFDTFSCSRTCTCLAHGCACVSADVTRLDLAHMFDATQEHRLREMSTFFEKNRDGTSVEVHTGSIDAMWRLCKMCIPPSLPSRNTVSLMCHLRQWQWRWSNGNSDLAHALGKAIS